MSVAIIAHAQSLSVGYVIGLQHNDQIAEESVAGGMQIESDAMTPFPHFGSGASGMMVPPTEGMPVARRDNNVKAILAVAAGVLFFSAAFVISALLNGLFDLPFHWVPADWRGVLDGLVYCALVGALFGVIASLDRESGIAVGHHTFWRSFLGGVIGAAAVLHWQWHAAALGMEALAAGFVVGALLGGLGWTWARILEHF